jgi:hypothetical protein
VSGGDTLSPVIDQPGMYTLIAACGECGAQDAVEVIARIAGDANGDRTVSVADVTIVLTSFGSACPQPTEPCMEDMNGDGIITIADVILTITNFGAIGP